MNGRYGGSAHDSLVWKMSGTRKRLIDEWRNGSKNSWLLGKMLIIFLNTLIILFLFLKGDSGYPLEPWLITPYRTEDASRARFNHLLSKTRNVVERTFGVLKGRFRAMLAARELHYTPEKTTRMLNVCCMLHNVCIHYNVDLLEEIVENEDEQNYNVLLDGTENGNIEAEAKRIREEIKSSIV